MKAAKRILRPEIQFPALVAIGMLMNYIHDELLLGFVIVLWGIETYVAGYALGDVDD